MSNTTNLTDPPINITEAEPAPPNATYDHPAQAHMPLQSRLVAIVAHTPAEQLRRYVIQAILGDLAVAEGLERVMVPSPRFETMPETTSATDTATPSRTVRGSGATVTCRKCEEEYDPDEEREEGECTYHPGELELDENASVWDDWDEYEWGEKECNVDPSEYPEGFVWSCCEGRGGWPWGGCVEEVHEPEAVETARVA